MRDAHRRPFGEAPGSLTDSKIGHLDPDAKLSGQDVGGSPAVAKVANHLGGHLGGVGAHSLRRHAVIARQQEQDPVFQRRIEAAGYRRQPRSQILQPPEAAPRLGERVLSAVDARDDSLVQRGNPDGRHAATSSVKRRRNRSSASSTGLARITVSSTLPVARKVSKKRDVAI